MTRLLRLTACVAAVAVPLLLPTSPAFANTAPTCSDSSHEAVNRAVHFDGTLCSDPDGDDIDFIVVEWPTGGSLNGDPETGVATYTAFFGTESDSFRFQVTDGQALSNVVTATITVPPPDGTNQPPACPARHFFVAPHPATTIISGNCVDPDDDPITYGLSSFPTQGVLGIVNASTVSYTPNAGTLTDSFGYTAGDGENPPVAATVSLAVATGNVFETAAEASPAQPFVASIESPAGGPVVVDARPTTDPPPPGFLLLGQEFDIEAPSASVANPLRLVFKIDGSAAPAGQLQVFRDMATNPDPIPNCDTADGTATPDPCVLSRVGAAPDDVEVTVLTSHASEWNFAVGQPYDFTGFFSPVNNQPAVNSASAGRAIPVKFSLNGDQGLDVLAPGYPKSQSVACDNTAPVDGIESTVTPGASALSYDAGSDRYQYVWKTDRSWSGCRQLVVKLADGTKHRATFRFR